jgi:hypothetical protein
MVVGGNAVGHKEVLEKALIRGLHQNIAAGAL